MVAIPHEPNESPLHMSEADYLAFEDQSDFKHEYVNGEVRAMTGGSLNHAVITVNTSTHLNNLLSDSPCLVTSPDLRLHIVHKKRYRYPDVMVFCGEPAYLPERTDTLTNPVLIVEVLSPSTEITDRNEKFDDYTQIATLKAYLLIAQNRVKIQSFQRHEGEKWLYQAITNPQGELALPALNITLSLAQLYHKVTFEPPADETDDAAQP